MKHRGPKVGDVWRADTEAMWLRRITQVKDGRVTYWTTRQTFDKPGNCTRKSWSQWVYLNRAILVGISNGENAVSEKIDAGEN